MVMVFISFGRNQARSSGREKKSKSGELDHGFCYGNLRYPPRQEIRPYQGTINHWCGIGGGTVP